MYLFISYKVACRISIMNCIRTQSMAGIPEIGLLFWWSFEQEPHCFGSIFGAHVAGILPRASSSP